MDNRFPVLYNEKKGGICVFFTVFPSPLGNLNQTLAEDYTISDLINTTLSLPSRDVEALLEYVELLKLRGPSDLPR